MTLRAVHGNRTEVLLGALIEALPPLDPFAPATIVVGSRLVSRWLTREVAIARGVATGLDLVTFDRFVERTVGRRRGRRARPGWSRSISRAARRRDRIRHSPTIACAARCRRSRRISRRRPRRATAPDRDACSWRPSSRASRGSTR